MANKFVDQNGLLYFWQKLLAKFQQKEENKGLSSNDYTNADKSKLEGIEANANKTTIIDNLTSEATDSALSAKQGKALNDAISRITTDIGDLGGGDMMTGIYDKDKDGVLDNGAIPKATATALGGIKVGENLSITEDGVLSADAQHIDVDGVLNAESVNPVQNKVVKAALDGKAASTHTHSATEITENETHRFVSDTEKAAWNNKVDKEEGKGLSTNDYTTADKTKLAGVAENANNYTHPESHAATMITEDATHRFATDDEKTAWNGKIDSSSKGQANGVASLDENGLIPSGQLPSYVDDVVEGYADVTTNTTTDESGYTTTKTTINGFYSDAGHKNAIIGEAGKIYIDVNTNISYRWGGTVFVTITSTDCTAVTNAEIDAIVATTV